jgi:hypothetical protein
MRDIANLTNTSDSERIAAAEAEIGALRGLFQFVVGVPEGLCDGASIFGSRSFGGSAIVRTDLVVNCLRVHSH